MTQVQQSSPGTVIWLLPVRSAASTLIWTGSAVFRSQSGEEKELAERFRVRKTWRRA